MSSSNPFGRCVYCGQQVMWLRTKAGRKMPVNPTIVDYRKPKEGMKGQEKVMTPEGEMISVDLVDHDKSEGYGYISHFATCKRRQR